MCLSLKSPFWKATLSNSQFRSSGAQNKVWVNWDDLQGNDSTRAAGATLTCSQQRRWLDSVKSVFRENRRHLGLSQVLRRGRGLLLLPSSRLAVNFGHSRIILDLDFFFILDFGFFPRLLQLPSSRLAVTFRHSRIVAAALLSSFFCHQLKRIKLMAETKTITKTNTISAPQQLFWTKNTQKRSFFFFSWGWGMFILNLLIFLPLRCQTVVSVPFYSSLLTLCFSQLKKWSTKQLDMECFNLKKPLIIALATPVLADSPLLSASAGGHLLNSLAACCFSPFSVNIGCLLFCTNIIFIPKFPSSVNIESRSFEGCSYECNIEGRSWPCFA